MSHQTRTKQEGTEEKNKMKSAKREKDTLTVWHHSVYYRHTHFSRRTNQEIKPMPNDVIMIYIYILYYEKSLLFCHILLVQSTRSRQLFFLFCSLCLTQFISLFFIYIISSNYIPNSIVHSNEEMTEEKWICVWTWKEQKQQRYSLIFLHINRDCLFCK